MTTAEFFEQLQTNLPTAAGVVLLLSVIAFILFRYGIARLFVSLAARSSTKYDDILVVEVENPLDVDGSLRYLQKNLK